MGNKLYKDEYITLMRNQFKAVRSMFFSNYQSIEGITDRSVDDLTYEELERVSSMYYEIMNEIQKNARTKQDFKPPTVENKLSKKSIAGIANISPRNLIGGCL